MATITVRSIPESLVKRVKDFSSRDRRSMNKELLVIIEEGVACHAGTKEEGAPSRPMLSVDAQAEAWEELCGVWDEDRTTDEIVRGIIGTRSAGREVVL